MSIFIEAMSVLHEYVFVKLTELHTKKGEFCYVYVNYILIKTKRTKHNLRKIRKEVENIIKRMNRI